MENYLIHYGVKGMKWGVRKDTPRSISNRAKKMEPKISRDVTSAINNTGAKVYGYEHRLKTSRSIARKTKLGKSINDAVRYTAVSSENDFVKNYNNIKKDLQRKGYTETRCKNYFEQYKRGKVKHKSVQCNYRNKDGYTFEIQFQTQKSQSVKDKKVPLYEEVRNPKVSDKRKAEILVQMVLLADSVPDPKNISKIKEHGE